MAGLVSQLPGVWLGKETGFIPRLQDLGVDSPQTWDDARLDAVVEAVNGYLGLARWERRASAAGARDYLAATGLTGYAGFIRYVWSLDEAPDGREPVVVGDQTPNYVLALPYLEQLFPDARYLHVVRDPRDVVASILPLRFGADSAAVAASDWNECVAGWWAASRRVPPDRRGEGMQRTNQLNFSGRHYSREEIAALVGDGLHESFVVACSDAYGDYGTVGFVLVDRDQMCLRDAMFSCRVQFKHVEHAVLSFLLDRYRTRAAPWFRARFHETERNGPAAAVFAELGFREISRQGPDRVFEFDLQQAVPDEGIVAITYEGVMWQPSEPASDS